MTEVGFYGNSFSIEGLEKLSTHITALRNAWKDMGSKWPNFTKEPTFEEICKIFGFDDCPEKMKKTFELFKVQTEEEGLFDNHGSGYHITEKGKLAGIKKRDLIINIISEFFMGDISVYDGLDAIYCGYKLLKEEDIDTSDWFGHPFVLVFLMHCRFNKDEPYIKNFIEKLHYFDHQEVIAIYLDILSVEPHPVPKKDTREYFEYLIKRNKISHSEYFREVSNITLRQYR